MKTLQNPGRITLNNKLKRNTAEIFPGRGLIYDQP